MMLQAADASNLLAPAAPRCSAMQSQCCMMMMMSAGNGRICIARNCYAQLQPVSVKIGNKWYHVSGEEMKSFGVDPWAKESEPQFDI
jgi:hypothetical protein